MPLQTQFQRKTIETFAVYRELVVVMVPIAIATQALAEFGVIKAVSPWLAPAMQLFGLPPELALAWLTGLLVGMWGGIVVLFTLIPTLALSSADMTVFSALLLLAHAIPVEQRIVARAGPNFWATSIIRIAGAMAFAALLHQLFAATGWLAQPMAPVWTPAVGEAGWLGFSYGLERLDLVLGAGQPAAPAVDLLLAPLEVADLPTAAALAEALRDAGVRVELDVRLRGAKANLRHADRTGIPLALLVGSRERERGEALLRRMESREERTVKLETLTSTVCRELAAGVSNGAH